MDARHDAGGRDRHTGFRNTNPFDQQLHCLHEVVVIQEGLALPHEDEIEAFALDVYSVVLHHQQDLPDNLPSSKVALDTKQRGQAELAVDCAPHLARDADGCALPSGFCCFPVLISGVLTLVITEFAIVALRHPYCLNALAVGERHQVANGSINRSEALLNGGIADGVTGAG